MTFYFAWVNTPEIFDAGRHARMDESILHFEVDHQEGAVPLLRLTVALAIHTPQRQGQRGILWQQDEAGHAHLLFDGILVMTPAEKREDFLLLVLEAGRADKPSQLERLLSTKKQQEFEPLLVAEEDQEAVEEVLESLSAVPHWDRLTGDVILTELGQHRETVDLGPTFFAESLQMHQGGRPLAAVRFSLTAEWVQRYDGVVDLGPLIQQAGTRGYLSSLTPDDLQKRWWRKVYPLLRTGYEILESRLTVVVPPETGGLEVYPLKSAAFTVRGRVQTLARSWLQPVLTLQWHYRQKRKETVHIEVPCGKTGDVLELSVRLQDICGAQPIASWKPHQVYPIKTLVRHEDTVYRAIKVHVSDTTFQTEFWEVQGTWPTALEDPSRWSFFETERGRAVIHHVMRRAEAYGVMAARELEVRCHLPFAAGRLLRGNQQVRLTDPRLPGGSVTGDVLHYRLVAEGDTGERWAEVTLGVTMHLMRAWKLKGLQSLKKAEGILDPRAVTAADLVTSLQLTGGAETQNQRLERRDFPSLMAAHRALDKIPTRLRIELKDLKSAEELSHEWAAEIL
ncbi:MAG: hypothetical protein A2977_00485 [Alphaproteobacteria bacterium RIFCSPLOWO2_01_FULL_45_8]|nr:MAG: hypothetical protein A2065_00505 [Alphaproteobacteria bacterium GWB1_45_5]OFW76570.1 MAG: hypothetical protein A3K20_00080 [Alphaproteobacteria bacterium GWA1_45_9]OFW89654.1 MAG: hypothetical protein A2621_01970 [Alphaproteobacteria bacterium RIFCSPHIGHO2_01_FULL_41_14]OFW96565.1 MAG: hypothetical protein A2977_00485 [Alphaproteobacteria bacterium RIFCSPLOWO2_01_FULL_45_8]HCI49094.1 hypothetical protein [Holosporales bacterium]